MRVSGSGGQAAWHDAFREWAEAELGDPRQVYAQRADAAPEDPLFFLPDGEARRFREAAQSGALLCPVPECPSRRLTTVACEDRRDHFRHIKKLGEGDLPGHGRSYTRVAAKSLLRHWAIDQDRVVEVREVSVQYRDEVERVAFILVAALDDGSSVALCYVDKRLGADAWEEHEEVLRSNGIVGVWIFALTKTYFDLPDPANPMADELTDLILDKAIFRRMRKRGSWPLLLNLEQREWANLVIPGGSRATNLGISSPALDRVLHLARSRLEDCRLCPHGVETPAINGRVLAISRRD